MVGDEASSVEDDAAGFVPEEVGVDVGDAEGAGALDDELLADFLFAEGEVGGGRVKDNVDPAAGKVASGAVGDPGVFADFEPNADALDVKDEVADGGDFALEVFGDNDAFWPGFEPARFVVEAISGEVLFCDEAGYLSVYEEGDGVVDGVFNPDGEAYGDDHALGFWGDFEEAGPGAGGDFVGEELILTAVAGDGEFGEAEDGDVGFAGFGNGVEDAAAIAGPVERDLVKAACAYADGVGHDWGTLP